MRNALAVSKVKWPVVLVIVLIMVSLYGLFAPPVSPTIWRQTQTVMLTENFVKEGFALKGLYLNIRGNQKLMMVYEFPIYNFIVGLFFFLFGNSVFWGKLVSLVASAISLFLIYEIVKKIFNRQLAVCAGVFFILSPLGMLMNTSFQPDALGLMFLFTALNSLLNWKRTKKMKDLSVFSFTFLLAGLSKFPVIVPYLPLIIGALLLCERGRLCMPKLRESAIVMFIFVIPFVAWYLYRGHVSDSVMSNKLYYRLFLIGDLRRFLSPVYYVKPFFVFSALAWSGIGTLFFLLGFRKMSRLEIMLLIGIPFYFIVVPTVRDQYYYLYAVVPVFALFMAKGFLLIRDYCVRKRILVFFYCCAIIYLIGFWGASSYTMRHDKVSLEAAEALKKVSSSSDLVFVATMHDRGQCVGGDNPSMLYLAGRKGWNVGWKSRDKDDIMRQIKRRRGEGARWMVLTWYTPELEPWFAGFLPSNLRRDPHGIRGGDMLDDFKKQYPIVSRGRHYAIMDLRGRRNVQP